MAERSADLQQACDLAKLWNVKIISVGTDAVETIDPRTIDFFEAINTISMHAISIANVVYPFKILIFSPDVNLLSSSHFNKNANPAEMCVMPYSSGTTGIPKGVMLSHTNITSNCEAFESSLPTERLIMPTTDDHQDVLPVVLPFYHCYGLVVLLVSKLALGCKLVTVPKFEMHNFLQTAGDHRASFLCLVPPLVVILGNKLKGPQPELCHVRHVMSAASHLAHRDAERFIEL